ncbi:MAG: protein kinase [Chloroflexi bacterium]|nr:protein kinase [Chloroflexota bacterium]MBP8054823.1 protein kinase [Chloroflexota bacterium]
MEDSSSIIGQTVGKYRIIERLGRGGMAEVYKAYDENLERFVALKLMHPFLADEGDFVGRFRREAKAMAALNHPNIVDVYDFSTTGGRSYIAMEYLALGSLKDKLEELANKGQRLSLAEAIQIILQITNALAYAHSRGMIHRDIKPPNIMFNDHGAAVLTDFGIAKVVSGPSYTQTGAMVGSPAYMSPEQGLGKPGDERSDIYSLGVLFFQLATGQLPYSADTPLAVVLKHVSAPVPDPGQLNPSIPDNIRHIIEKAMAKEPTERYQSAKALADDLRQVLRTGDPVLLGAVPAELLKEQATPPPMSGVGTPPPVTTAYNTPRPVLEGTRIAPKGDKTMMIPTVGGEATEVMPKPASGRKFPWAIVGVVGVILLLILAVGAGLALGRGSGDATPTPTATQEIAVVVQETPDITATVTGEVITEEATATLESESPTSGPTATEAPLPSVTVEPPTLAPTHTNTPDATATQMALCEANPAVNLLSYYTYQNTQSTLAPAGTVSLRLNLVLENNSTLNCVWPTNLQLVVIEGEDFGLTEPVTLPGGLVSGANTTVTLNGLDTPNQVTTLESTWQLQTADGEPFGLPFEVEIRTYVPATATPVPTATSLVVATATSGAPLNFSWDISACEYPGGDLGTEYRCVLSIHPSGGGGLYTIEVFDQTPPSRYENRTGTARHYLGSRRCAPWVHEVIVTDETNGTRVTQNIYFDPTVGNYFPGGAACVLPGG